MKSKLIEKFFRKECTPEEAKQVLEWFSHQEVKPYQEDDLLSLWQEAKKEKLDLLFTYDPQQSLGLIHQQINQRYAPPSDTEHRRQVVRLSNSWAYALRVAAILFIPFLFTLLFVDFTQPEDDIVPSGVIAVKTPAGVKRTKILPDGSKVILNARSTITYGSGFNESKREVTLLGEAFFEVAKDSGRPFIVHSGRLPTTALGTSFNINYRPDNKLTEVSLATGIVQIVVKDEARKMKSTKLQPGERLNYHIKEAAIHTDHFDELEILAWKENILYFKKAGIEQVVQKLEDWYGVEIVLEGNTDRKLGQGWTYTGMFEDQNLENVLTGIGYVKDFSFKINEKNVKIMFN